MAREPYRSCAALAAALLFLLSCRPGSETSLVELRASLESEALMDGDPTPALPPLDDRLALVSYVAPNGPSPAYVSASALQPWERLPAIVWVSGGFAWGVDPWMAEPGHRSNDQSLDVFLRSDLVVMAPALRGWSGAPGSPECFLGEVDDVLAAVRWLKEQPGVDPERVFVGGHSTGGTLALLVAASEPDVAGVISFGPVADPGFYGVDCPPLSMLGARRRARVPREWMDRIDVPTWLVEGQGNGLDSSNADSVRRLRAAATGNDNVQVRLFEGFDHFSVLRPTLDVLVAQIVAGEAASTWQVSAAQLDASGGRR